MMGFFTLIAVIKELLSAGKYIWQLIREQKEYEQRRAMAKEFKESIKDAVQSMDNSRLVRLFDPSGDPFPRGMLDKKDPHVQ